MNDFAETLSRIFSLAASNPHATDEDRQAIERFMWREELSMWKIRDEIEDHFGSYAAAYLCVSDIQGIIESQQDNDPEDEDGNDDEHNEHNGIDITEDDIIEACQYVSRECEVDISHLQDWVIEKAREYAEERAEASAEA